MGIYKLDGTETTTAYDRAAASLDVVYDIHGTVIELHEDPGPGPQPDPDMFLDTATATVVSSISISAAGIVQGACTDGEYIYMCEGDSSNYTYMNVLKVRISDGAITTVRYNGTPNFGHANDMAYNPTKNWLYVCTMLSDGSVIVLDAADLSYVKTIYLDKPSGGVYEVWQICFNRNNGMLYSAVWDEYERFAAYDEEGVYVSSFSVPNHPSATGQGCETDGSYIYRITYNPNLIDVMTIDGTFVKTLSLSLSGEPEALMCDWNGTYYANLCKSGQNVYRVQMFKS